MELRKIVEDLLKEKKLTRAWLASKVKMKPDGLRLALTVGSLKFNQIVLMSDALQVSPTLFFPASEKLYQEASGGNYVSEPDKAQEYRDNAYKNEINALKLQNKKLREEVAALKEQVADKAKIIKLLEDKRR